MWQDLIGKIGMLAGASGSPTIPAGVSIISIAAHASAGGASISFGGATIPIVSGAPPLVLQFRHLLWTAAAVGTLTFTGTDSYLVEYVRQAHAS